MEEEKKTKIKVVELNNKSRKGKYIYAKKKGKQGRYYKVNENDNIQDKIRQITSRKKKTKTKRKKQKKVKTKKPKTYLDEIKRKPKLETTIQKGITQTTIKKVHQANAHTIRNAQIELLKPLIKDKKLLNEITKPENTQKLKHRYENEITIKDANGRTVTTATKYNTTPEEIIQELKKEIKINQQFEYIQRTLKKLGYKTEGKDEGIQVSNIDLKITFRKGETTT